MVTKKVCLIYTGGTIGMKPTENGYAPEAGYLKQELDSTPEFHSEEMPFYDLIEYNPLLDSSCISVDGWVQIAKDIEKRYDQYDGFVVLHGTDTMAYTASALSFMLKGLTKPVILTGSQIPFFELRNDARDNLITSMLIAANEEIPEVCLYFAEKLYRGNRATKISSEQLDAFASPNYPPLAKAGIRIVKDKKHIREKGEGFCLCGCKKVRIAVIKLFPGIQFGAFCDLLTPSLKGIVLEAFGSGNVPSGGGLEEFLEKAKKNGTVVVVCTQCLKGAAVIGQYAASDPLVKAGAVSGYDMTVEAVVSKLYYLLSQELSPEETAKKMQENLRGELTPPGTNRA